MTYRPPPASNLIYIPKSKVPKTNRMPAESGGRTPVSGPAQVELENVKQKQREARAATELMEALFGADKELHAHEGQHLDNWRTGEAGFEAAAQETRRRYLAGLTSPEARAEFGRRFDELYIPRHAGLRSAVVAGEVAHHRRLLAEAAAFYAGRAVGAATGFDRAHAGRKFERLLRNAERGHFLSPQQAQAWRADFASRVSGGAPGTAQMASGFGDRRADPVGEAGGEPGSAAAQGGYGAPHPEVAASKLPDLTPVSSPDTLLDKEDVIDRFRPKSKPAGLPERDLRSLDPQPQKPFVKDESSLGDAPWEIIPRSVGGPRDEWASTSHVPLKRRSATDRPDAPFDPAASYYDRVERKVTDKAKGLSGLATFGRDIDGRPYATLLRVGTDYGDDHVNELTPKGAEVLSGLLFDDTIHFASSNEAAKWLESQGYELQGPIPERAAGFYLAMGAQADPADRRLVLVTIGSRTSGPLAKTKLHEAGHLISDLLNLEREIRSLSPHQKSAIEGELFEVMRMMGHVDDRGGWKQEMRDWAGSPEEWIGEFFQSYLERPEETKRAAPLFAALIRKLWNENERLSRVLVFS